MYTEEGATSSMHPCSGAVDDMFGFSAFAVDSAAFAEPAAQAGSGAMSVETREFQKMMQVVTAAHGLLRQGKSLAPLERAYNEYTRFCNGGAGAAGSDAYAERAREDARKHFAVLCERVRRAAPATGKPRYRESAPDAPGQSALPHVWQLVFVALERSAKSLEKALDA